MSVARSTRTATLDGATRSFARHVHAGTPFTRDLHHLRDLRQLTEELVAALGNSDARRDLRAYQRDAVITVERERVRWPENPVEAAATVLTRAEWVSERILAPQGPLTRRPALLRVLLANVADGRDALHRGGADAPALVRSLTQLADRYDRSLGRTLEARLRAGKDRLKIALVDELDAALQDHARLSPEETLRIAFSADRVLEAWRQLVELDHDPEPRDAALAAWRSLARATRERRGWENPPADALAWIAPRRESDDD